jgi:hypothetical protein
MTSRPSTAAPILASPNRPRNWMTFSLRTLLISATLLSVVLAYFANILLHVRQQQAIRREIEIGTGAEVYFDHECVGGDEVDQAPPGPAIVRWLCGNYAYDHIDVVNFDFLNNVKARDGDLPVLLKAPQLQDVSLNGPEVSDQSLKIVGRLRDLRELQLWNTQVSDDGLAEIAHLRKLRLLNLHGTPLTSAALPHIAKLQSLERLHLWNTSISDQNLELLADLKQLRQLYLPSGVSFEKAQQLKRKLPNCQISLRYPNSNKVRSVNP